MVHAPAILGELGDRANVASVLEALASMAGERQPARAARLWSAAARLREEIGSPLPPADRLRLEQEVAAARAAAQRAPGDATFQRAWPAGQGLSLEQTIEHALGE